MENYEIKTQKEAEEQKERQMKELAVKVLSRKSVILRKKSVENVKPLKDRSYFEMIDTFQELF